ncbi:hypothetical protein [Virgisporangium aliadipatigenens]|nr:hypothetical protein [Virgisporangium aliadipatigenens]
MLLRRFVRTAAAVTATVALLVVLFRQFEGDPADTTGPVLAGALAAWWFVAGPPARAAASSGRMIEVAAWAARGAGLAGAAVYYASQGLDRARPDPVLAAFAVGLIGARVLQTVARRRGTGATNPLFPGGRRRALLIARWVGYVLLAVFARYVGLLAAVVLFWVPTRVHGWPVVPLAVLWAVVVGIGFGMIQVFSLRRSRVTYSHAYSAGLGVTHTTEDWQEQELLGPPVRTGLAPLLQARQVVGGWQSASSGYGSWGSTNTTTWADGWWQVRLVQFPPAYVPFWIDRPIRSLFDRRKRLDDGGE